MGDTARLADKLFKQLREASWEDGMVANAIAMGLFLAHSIGADANSNRAAYERYTAELTKITAHYLAAIMENEIAKTESN